MTEYKGKTDQLTKITLTSSIEQVLWDRAIASPRGAVVLEIFTHFVGNGAELQIELSDGNGKKHGVFRETISGNRFWASIQVPERAEKALVATAKLPKHGLEMTSAALLLTPPLDITDPRWSAAEARRGDTLELTATVRGAFDGTPANITIWEHDADGVHDLVTRLSALVRSGRVEASWDYQYHEDVDDIPTQEETEQGYTAPEYFFRVDVGGVRAESPLLRFKDWFEAQLVDENGEGIADQDYVLHLPDGSTRRGRTDAEGRLREEDVPPGPVLVEYPGCERAGDSPQLASLL